MPTRGQFYVTYWKWVHYVENENDKEMYRKLPKTQIYLTTTVYLFIYLFMTCNEFPF